MAALVAVLDSMGDMAVRAGKELWRMAALCYDTLCALFSSRGKGSRWASRQMVSQILFTGVEALPLVGAVALLCGVTIIVQSLTNMPRLGASDYFGKILNLLVIRELGPFFTSLIVIGRSGSGLASYIAGMRVSREVTALEVMGIEPIHFLVVPAFIGMVVSMMVLGVYFVVIAILGGMAIATPIVNVSLAAFAQSILQLIQINDLFLSLLKNAFFGMVIAVVSCHEGLNARTIRDVPRAARRSVIGSLIAVMLINVAFTVGVYGR